MSIDLIGTTMKLCGLLIILIKLLHTEEFSMTIDGYIVSVIHKELEI